MPTYAVLALAAAFVLVAVGVALVIGRVVRQRDTQIPRKDEES